MNPTLKKTVLFLTIIFLTRFVWARSNIFPSGGRSEGMGNAFISQYDLSSAFHNQAGLAGFDTLSVMISYENRYMISELSLRSALIGIPTKTGNFALHFSAFGPAKWMESNLSLAYAKQLSKNISGGIQINYFGMVLPEENKTLSSVGAELGFIFRVTPRTFLGIHVANPFSVPFSTASYSEKIPWNLRVGCHYLVSDHFTLAVEGEKAEGSNPVIKMGMEWEAMKNLFFRSGFNSGSSKFFAGLGFKYHFVKADLAFNYNQYLGTSPVFSLTFDIK